MSHIINLIKNAFKYYDKNKEKYHKFISKVKYIIRVSVDNDIEPNIIKFYDKNKKKIFESRYQIIGKYDDNMRMWSWGWHVPIYNKNETKMSTKILQYGLDLSTDLYKKDSAKNQFLKMILTKSQTFIVNELQLDVHLALASYLAKIPLIFPIYLPIDTKKVIDGEYIIINEKFRRTDKYYMTYLFIIDYEKLIE